MSQTIDEVYRDFVVPGIPGSGDHEPEKPEIRALLKQIQNSGGLAVTRNTLAALTAVTPPSELYMGVVLDDPDPANNGYYSRSGAAWVFGRGFPDSIASLISVGGTPDAITASTEAWVNPSDARLFLLVTAAENTGPVTIAINGATAKPLVTSTGGPIPAAGIPADMLISFTDDGTSYRLATDINSAAIQAAAEAAAEAAEDSAAEAAGYAAAALSNWTVRRFAGDGIETDFDLLLDPGSEGNCFAIIDGITQDTGTYSLSGTVLIFSEAPPEAADGEPPENIEIRFGTALEINVPADLSVNNGKVADNAINARTIDGTDALAIKTKLGIADTSIAPNSFSGFRLTNAADTANDITIGPGACASDDAAPVLISLTTAITKRLDAAWAAGNNNGGLDTGAVATDSSYHLWAIRNPTSGVVDVLFSVSASAPTMPAGYTQKCYLWPVLRLSSVLRQFVHQGNYFLLTGNVPTANTPIGTSAALLRLPNVPAGVNLEVDFDACIFSSGANLHAYFSSPLANDNTPAPATYSSLVTPGAAAYASGRFTLITNTSAQIRHRGSAAISNFTALPIGYRFNR